MKSRHRLGHTSSSVAAKRSSPCSIHHSTFLQSLPLPWLRYQSTLTAAAKQEDGAPYKLRKLLGRKQRREFLDKVGKSLGVLQMEDWYTIKHEDVVRVGGGFGLSKISLQEVLMKVYPDFEWDTTRFVERGLVPDGYWKKKEHVITAMRRAEELLGIKEANDWYSIRLTDLKVAGFPIHSVSKTQLVQLLEEVYPQHRWDSSTLLRGRFSLQKRFEKAIALLFPDSEIERNVQEGTGVINPVTGAHFELDVYLPELSLALEFQEKHHYIGTEYTYAPLEEIKQRDKTKAEAARAKGISLVIIPAWWDGTIDSLAATIRKELPHLLPEYQGKGEAIPEEMPPNFLKKNDKMDVKNIGEPTTACFFTLSDIEPKGWWLFEKYDGIRGFWNPEEKVFYSRYGNKFTRIPQHIIDAMPTDMYLDGEIWFGRDRFQESMKIVNRLDPSRIDWTNFNYMVFDAPKHDGVYSERYNYLVKESKKWEAPFLKVAAVDECKDEVHLETFFQDIIDGGGEGIILRDPQAPYQAGRSQGYLKHKRFRDAEAKIVQSVGHSLWECELPNGVRFTAAAGTSEFTKRFSPKAGDIVSFKHHGYLTATKKPKFPLLYRMRNDLTWQEVVDNWMEKKPAGTVAPIRRKKATNKKPRGYWSNPDHWREFFIEYATEAGFDPFVASNWENISATQLCTKKGGSALLPRFLSKTHAIESALPELRGRIKDQPHQRRRQMENTNC